MEKLNLVQILRDCPKGTKLYSPIFGEVIFDHIDSNEDYPILVMTETYGFEGFRSDGKFLCGCFNSECMLYPSKDQRDWSKFVAPKPDLPEGTWVMCRNMGTYKNTWKLNRYFRDSATYNISHSKDRIPEIFDIIIPFDKFNPDNIEECIKKYNYGTKQ